MKKLRIFIVFIMLVCYPTFSYAQIYKQADIGNGSYIIGTYLFNKEKTATYNGTLTTPMIMMASKTITGNDLTNKKIYFKNSRGKWINAITGQSESNIPSTFEITCVNMNCQNNISPVIDSYDTYKNSDIVNGAYIIGTHIFNKDKNDVYNGTLTTPMIMLASKTITGNALSDMNIYFKNSRGKWISAITGKIIDSVPSNFNISHINLNKTESKDKATDTITVTTKTSNYTGSGIQPTVKTTSGLTATLTYYSDSSCATKTTTSNAVSAGGAPKNAGTYYVKATTTGNVDYNASSLGCTKAVVINKANATCPTLTEYSGTYDGTAKKITVSGGKGGTIQYRTSTTGTWSNTNPGRTNAGTSTIYVQVLGDSNHNTVDCGSKTLKVNKKAITVTASNQSKTYDGTALNANNTCTVIPGSMVSGHALTCTSTGTQTNAGSSTKTLSKVVVTNGTTDVSSNYEITKKNGTLTVNKATDKITVTAKTSNYTGSGIQPTVKTTSGLTATLTYYSDSSCATKTTTSNAVSAGGAPKNAGTYYVKATTAGNTNYDSSSLSCTKAVVINKVNATCPTLTGYSGNYDGNAHTITVSGGSGGTIQYRTSTTGTWSNTKPTRTKVGTSTVYVQVLGDSNHNTVSCGSKTILVKQKLTLDVTEKTLTIGDRFKVTPTMYPMYDIEYSVDNPDDRVVASVDDDGIITAIAGGEATVIVKANGETAQIKIIVQNPNLIMGYLETEGTNIVNSTTRETIILKGYNVGAWLSRSYSMSAVVPLDETLVKNGTYSCINNESFHQILRSRFSEAQVDDISETWYNNFMKEFDWNLIAQSGANVIRLPFEYSLFEKLGDKEAFALIDKAIEECKKRGIYVIIDLHLAPGRQNEGGYCGTPQFLDIEKGKTERSAMVELWGKIAAYYVDEPAVAAYDLLNEPGGNSDVLLKFYDDSYNEIRKYDDKHIIIMEESCVNCGWGNGNINNPESIGILPNPSEVVYYLDPKTKTQEVRTSWTNVMYSTHDYFSVDNYECYTLDGILEPAKEINGKLHYCVLPTAMKNRFEHKFALIQTKMSKYQVPYYIGEFSYLGDKYNKSGSSEIYITNTPFETSQAFHYMNDVGDLIYIQALKSRYREYLSVWQYAMRRYDGYKIDENKSFVMDSDGNFTIDSEILPVSYTTWTYKANHDPYFGTVYYGTQNSETMRADLLKDNYDTLISKFSASSSDYMWFNVDLYNILTNQFGGRYAQSIDVDKNNVTLNVGETIIVNYTVSPSKAIQKQATWTSSDSNVATVDANTGKIEAKGNGTATIKAIVYPLKNENKTTNNSEYTIKIPSGYPSVHNYPVDANNNEIYPSATITVTVN